MLPMTYKMKFQTLFSWIESYDSQHNDYQTIFLHDCADPLQFKPGPIILLLYTATCESSAVDFHTYNKGRGDLTYQSLLQELPKKCKLWTSISDRTR